MQMEISAIPEIQSVGTSQLGAVGLPQSPCPEGNKTEVARVVTRSAAAERMRLHRERKKNGMRCVMIELRETEIEALIQKQLLKPEI